MCLVILAIFLFSVFSWNVKKKKKSVIQKFLASCVQIHYINPHFVVVLGITN